MNFRYTEELINTVFREQVLPVAREEVKYFRLQYRTMGIIKRTGQNRTNINCILDINENGLLIIMMDAFDAGKSSYFEYIEFSNIQGVKCKETVFFHKIKLQMKQGDFYKIHLNKTGILNIPDQAKNAKYIASTLSSKFQDNMKHPVREAGKHASNRFAFIYLATLILCYLLAFGLLRNQSTPEKTALIAVGIFLGHFLGVILISLVITLRKAAQDRKFEKEYRPIMDRYKANGDDMTLYQSLKNMKLEPETEIQKMLYYTSLSSAANKIGAKQEALDCLNTLERIDQSKISGNLQFAIDKLRENILKQE